MTRFNQNLLYNKINFPFFFVFMTIIMDTLLYQTFLSGTLYYDDRDARKSYVGTRKDMLLCYTTN